ncbi:MAPEG family protein [uncultured Hoeflea sp.]|uniref:MAPEG family protein n=1 Tax=uncultured Hoeflea sp. TaxID=538666 RepID=UPI0030ED57FC|tara:strand:+ start:667 stop:1083 length:417 start_codon:yes stop_codon:yes gene_type:complete
MQNLSPALSAVGIYAALNMAVLLWIAIETGRLRGKHKVSVGDGGVKHLIRINRGHANAVENMPMFFTMLVVGTLIGMPILAVHGLGLVFTIGRALHAWHFIQEDAPAWQRGGGFSLSFLAQVVLLVGLLGHGLWTMIG